MRRSLVFSLIVAAAVGSALCSAPALADPGIVVNYHDGLLRVTLEGSYRDTYYQIWRSGDLVGQYNALSSQFTLCTGDCYLSDVEVTPGKTYYYRFDLLPPAVGSSLISYGPYAVTIPNTPVGARIWPNPSNGLARVQLSVPGNGRLDAPVAAEARVIDLQGRTVRTLYRGVLSRGLTTLDWDGRSDAGGPLGAGIYFVQLNTSLGASTSRIVRFR